MLTNIFNEASEATVEISVLSIHSSISDRFELYHQTTSKILNSLSQYSLMESAALMGSLDLALNGTDARTSLNSILEGMDELDSTLAEQLPESE